MAVLQTENTESDYTFKGCVCFYYLCIQYQPDTTNTKVDTKSLKCEATCLFFFPPVSLPLYTPNTHVEAFDHAVFNSSNLRVCF